MTSNWPIPRVFPLQAETGHVATPPVVTTARKSSSCTTEARRPYAWVGRPTSHVVRSPHPRLDGEAGEGMLAKNVLSGTSVLRLTGFLDFDFLILQPHVRRHAEAEEDTLRGGQSGASQRRTRRLRSCTHYLHSRPPRWTSSSYVPPLRGSSPPRLRARHRRHPYVVVVASLILLLPRYSY